MGRILTTTLKAEVHFHDVHISVTLHLFYKPVFFNHLMEQTTNSLLLDNSGETTHSSLWAGWKEMRRQSKNKMPLETQRCSRLNCSYMAPHRATHFRVFGVCGLSLSPFFCHCFITSKVMVKLHPKSWQCTLGDSPKQAVAHTLLFNWEILRSEEKEVLNC